MLHTFIARTVGLFRGESRADGDHTDAGHDDPPERSSSLYTCPSCERTYISSAKSTCSRCDEPVERVPDETELGIGAR